MRDDNLIDRALPIRLLERRRATLLCPTALFLEYEAVLSRADISFRLRPMLRDAADEMVLETALNGPADAIVTHNVKDFGPAPSFGVEITTPGSRVRRLSR